MYAVSERDIGELSGQYARPYLIGMISAFVSDDMKYMTDAERLDAIRTVLAAYRGCRHQISGEPGFGAR